MERRTFVKGAFGLVVIAAGAAAGVAGMQGASPFRGEVIHTTRGAVGSQEASGPLMQDDIELIAQEAGGAVSGYYGETELFHVDEAGARLITLADGSRTIEDIALAVSAPAADVALFFASLGEAGYLVNPVYVNIIERTA